VNMAMGWPVFVVSTKLLKYGNKILSSGNFP
jgi:hypothetical protein